MERDITTVRVRSSYWSVRNIAYLKKEIILMRRLSKGSFIFFDDPSNREFTEKFIKQITNFTEAGDGLYELKIVDREFDPSTGRLVGHKYMLIPLEVKNV